MREKTKGKKTLLMSVLMSAPGPLIIGLGLMAGRSATQMADFVRRSAELLAIIVSFAVYCKTEKFTEEENEKKEAIQRQSNRFVGSMMCLGGLLMMLTTFLASGEEKGNVITGLVIALLGVIANTIFWFRYAKLSGESNNAILAVQARLYRAKSLVDICVTTALTSVYFFPEAAFSYYLDLIGSLVVEIYLIYCGIKTMREAGK
ncbi:MAG: cation transporter [Lachnospiraceae bacterium]|nr:cation transporter [Lachnospiraceae bacterium]